MFRSEPTIRPCHSATVSVPEASRRLARLIAFRSSSIAIVNARATWARETIRPLGAW
jgi:hypothetical protein